ncbi:MAG: Uma2 family endonuclease, partial [Gemmataceae bacterium]
MTMILSPRSTIETIAPQLYRLSVIDYERMVASGAIEDGTRIELLDGLLVEKMSQNPPHSSCLQTLTKLFLRLLPTELDARFQSPLTLKHSVPEPDVAIVRGGQGNYKHRHPTAGD